MKVSVHDIDHGWKAILARANEIAAGAYVKVGIVGDNGVRPAGSGLSVAEYAAVNEFGSSDGHTPERSFMRGAFDKTRDELEAVSRKVAEAVVLDRKMTVARGLGIIGAKHAADIKNFITAGAEIPPPNAPSTVARKMAAGNWNAKGKAQKGRGWGVRTLVDTGRLVQSITWAVVTGKAAR